MRRLILSFITVFACITFSFFLIHLVPGDPVDLILGEEATPIDQSQLKKQMGLDLPLSQQYLSFIKNVFMLDFGKSIYNKEPVWELVKKTLSPTLYLTLWVLILSISWGIPMAILTAFYKNTWLDRIMSIISVCGFSLPVFFSAPILIWIFAIHWPLLPIQGGGNWTHVVLPAISLAFPLGAALCQMGRTSILEILHEDYIRTAHSKGLSPALVYFKHALRPALIPIITILSLQLAALLTGTIIVETIFDWPGIGLLFFRSITRRDYPVIQACVLVIALIYLSANWLADLAYKIVHPKMRTEHD